MADRTELTTVETVREKRSWLFTIRDRHGERDEVILVPCDDSVEPCSTSSRPQADDSVELCSTGSQRGSRADNGVEAWLNRCTHEAQRLDTGRGVAMRDGEIICPKHGSMFDSCSGYCDNGEAADTTLQSIDIAVEGGTVYLVDDEATFLHEGGVDADEDDDDDDDDGPASTSHLSF